MQIGAVADDITGATDPVATSPPGWKMTPTNASLGALDLARLSQFDAEGRHVAGDKPTSESFLHFAMYGELSKAGAVVHLQSAHAIAVGIPHDMDPASVMPAPTAYNVMRVGRLPLVPCFAPGGPDLAYVIRALAGRHPAVLPVLHSPVVAGPGLADARYAAGELEDTARLFLTLQSHAVRALTPAQVAELRTRFNLP